MENIQPRQRGLGNAVQVAGYRLGMVIAGGVLLAAFAWLGWQGTVLILAALMLLSVLVLWAWQPTPVIVNRDAMLEHWLDFIKTLWPWPWVLLSYKVGDAFGCAMIRPQMIDLGMSIEDFAALLGVWGG